MRGQHYAARLASLILAKTAAEFMSPAQHLNFLSVLDLITLAQKCEQMKWRERVLAGGKTRQPGQLLIGWCLS